MTEVEYAALPAFMREWPKATIEVQYRDNGKQLRAMANKGTTSGYDRVKLLAKAKRYEELGRPA